jgi:hypothetical protein
MLAVSKQPVQMMNETNLGWTREESWEEVPEALATGQRLWGQLHILRHLHMLGVERKAM